MKKSRRRRALSFCNLIASMIALVFIFHGCSVATKTAQPVPRMTAETVEDTSKRIENPETGDSERQVVHETETTAQESSTKKSGSHQSSDSTEYLLISLVCLLTTLLLYQLN